MSFAEDANARAKKRALELEADRIIRIVDDAGVPEDCLAAEPNAIESILDIGTYDKTGAQRHLVAQSVFSPEWMCKHTHVVISGGSEQDREMVGNICLARAIMRRTNWDGTVAKKMFMAQITPLLNSYEKSRFDMVEDMSSCAVLMLMEIPPPLEVSLRNDMKDLLDSVLIDRRNNKCPTILTLSDKAERYRLETKLLGKEMARTFDGLGTGSDNIIWLNLAADKEQDGDRA